MTQDIKRRYGVHYFFSVHDPLDAVAMRSAASAEVGAIRASVVRLFLKEYAKAVVYDRMTMVPLYALRVVKNGIEIHYGSGPDNQKRSVPVKAAETGVAVH
jgi:hypothetical protein